MKKEFKPAEEFKRNKELLEEIEKLNLPLYERLKNTQFKSVEKANALLEKFVFLLKEISYSLDSLVDDPKAYIAALTKLGKELDGYRTYLAKSTTHQAEQTV